ncbi:CD209 antigen-like [Cheilinus undulatus]|uniref:CD209 antigen-like n=1 Tax=Cheilinus undulatus TaxID=241271 RepID=UPI001BD499BB|nr:CD209 antigen-like [Cheilinus undulatus]
MDESHIYENRTNITPDHSGQGKNLPESSQKADAYENISQSLEMSMVGTSLSGAQDVKKRSYRIATVCLGLLCALLLAGLIVLALLHTKHVSEWNSYNEELRISYNNVTKDRNQLKTTYNNLASERDHLQTSYSNMVNQRDQLQTRNNDLTNEKQQLQKSLEQLTSWRNDLHRSYNDVTKERNQLQTSYNNLTSERDQLQTSYNNLTSERDQLQTSYNNLTHENEQLWKTLEELTTWRNDLPRRLRDHDGWVYFGGSFYFVSSLERSWDEGRADCQSRGADLVIINSRAEQDFARTFKKRLWIGLTDTDRHGTWKWVDGTPLTTRYWAPSEPNGKHEHCAEIKLFDLENSLNDESCNNRFSWICEKRFAL